MIRKSLSTIFISAAAVCGYPSAASSQVHSPGGAAVYDGNKTSEEPQGPSVADLHRQSRLQNDPIVKLYPNPVSDPLKLGTDKYIPTMDFTIYTLHGIKAYTVTIKFITPQTPILIPVSGLARGTYLIRMDYGGKTVKQGIVKI